jgi:hypothetical protein
MKKNIMLTTASVLSVLFFSFHLADDIVRGMEPGTLTNLTAVPIYVFWLYGTLVLAGRLSGYIITLLGGLFALLAPLAHMRGKGVGVASGIANSSGSFFFVWTLIAIGVTGLFSVILSVRGLWGMLRAKRDMEKLPV